MIGGNPQKGLSLRDFLSKIMYALLGLWQFSYVKVSKRSVPKVVHL
jgi:hypothetical protein